MKVLVTAGNTMALLDKVRCITNIFSGRTGASIALEANRRGHSVTLLTSHPEAVTSLTSEPPEEGKTWQLRTYRTFEELRDGMMGLVPEGSFDTIVHCAAVSDYLSGGVYSRHPQTRFDVELLTWDASHGQPSLIDRAAGKVKSDEPELWVRLVRAPKLVDLIRPVWGFTGVLVKFKLEVGLDDKQLLEVAERSRAHSNANLMVANTLEGSSHYAFLGNQSGYERISRRDLPRALLDAITALVEAR